MGRFASLITGKTTRTLKEDDSNQLTPPQMSPPAVRQRDRQRMLNRLKGANVRESLIPDDADRLKGTVKPDAPEHKSRKGPAIPELPGPDGMFPVATALIAPDVMPDLYKPLSPSKIPSASRMDGSRFDAPDEPEVVSPPGESAMDTLLDRDQEDVPTPANAAVLNSESFLKSLGTTDGLPKTVPVVTERIPMPEMAYRGTEPVITAPPISVNLGESVGGGLGAALLRGGMPMPAPDAGSARPPSLFRDYTA